MQSSPPKRSFNPVGFAIGITFGILYGIAIDSIPLGIAMGGAFGFSLSLALGSEHKEFDAKKEKRAVTLFVLGLVALLLLFLGRVL
jgi:threonine/homoserine efflux transporter RhtA